MLSTKGKCLLLFVLNNFVACSADLEEWKADSSLFKSLVKQYNESWWSLPQDEFLSLVSQKGRLQTPPSDTPPSEQDNNPREPRTHGGPTTLWYKKGSPTDGSHPDQTHRKEFRVPFEKAPGCFFDTGAAMFYIYDLQEEIKLSRKTLCKKGATGVTCYESVGDVMTTLAGLMSHLLALNQDCVYPGIERQQSGWLTNVCWISTWQLIRTLNWVLAESARVSYQCKETYKVSTCEYGDDLGTTLIGMSSPIFHDGWNGLNAFDFLRYAGRLVTILAPGCTGKKMTENPGPKMCGRSLTSLSAALASINDQGLAFMKRCPNRGRMWGAGRKSQFPIDNTQTMMEAEERQLQMLRTEMKGKEGSQLFYDSIINPQKTMKDMASTYEEWKITMTDKRAAEVAQYEEAKQAYKDLLDKSETPEPKLKPEDPLDPSSFLKVRAIDKEMEAADLAAKAGTITADQKAIRSALADSGVDPLQVTITQNWTENSAR